MTMNTEKTIFNLKMDEENFIYDVMHEQFMKRMDRMSRTERFIYLFGNNGHVARLFLHEL